MARKNQAAVRFSDREIEMIQEIKNYVGIDNQSETIRYAINHTYFSLVGKKAATLVDGNPRYEDGDYAHDVALEIERLR